MNPTPTFTAKEITKHLAILQESDTDFHNPNGVSSATYFQKAAEKDIDIAEAIPALIDLFRESNNVTIMTPAGAAITRYYLNIKDYDAIQTLVTRATYPSYFLSPLCRFYEKKIVPHEILRLMMSYSEEHRFVVSDIFKFHVVAEKDGRDARIAEVVELFKEIFKEKTAHSRWLIELGIAGIDINRSLLLLLESLNNEKEKIAIASDLSRANLSGIDFSRAKDILLPFLKDESINENIALALARVHAQKEDFESLDKLLEYNSINIQKSVIRAMGEYVRKTPSSNYEFTHRVFKALGSKEIVLQKAALGYLLMNEINGLDIRPNEADLNWLIDCLAEPTTNTVLLPLLARCLDKDKAMVLKILSQIQNPKNQQVELLKICKNIAEKKYTSICPICEKIPRQQSYGDVSSVSEKVKVLIPKIHPDEACAQTLRTCPECANLYLYEHQQESDYDRMGTDHTIKIHRLLTVELPPYLLGQALEDYKNQLNDRVARYHCDLSHPIQYLREDAAYALLIYYKAMSNFEAINQLILQPNEDIVLVVLKYFNESFVDKIQQLPLDVLSNIENCITRFAEHAEIQSIASFLCTTKALLKNEKEKALALMTYPSDSVREGAFKTLYFLYIQNKIDVRPYEEALLNAVDDKTYSTASYVIYLLDDLIQKNAQNFDCKVFIQNQLGSKPVKKQEQGLKFLRTYIEVSNNYAFAAPLAIQALNDRKLSYHALNILKIIPLTETALQTEILGYLERELKKRDAWFSFDLFTMLFSIYNQGIHIEHLLPEVAVWLNLFKRKYRYSALQLLTIARQRGVDLTFAETELLAANLKNNDSYDQDIVRILMYIYLNNNNSKAVSALLTDKSQSCRTAATAYLNEYPKKSTVEIAGFVEAVIANTSDKYLYTRQEAHKALGYFQNRNVWDKKLIDSLL